jgi:hypothetical protein
MHRTIRLEDFATGQESAIELDEAMWMSIRAVSISTCRTVEQALADALARYFGQPDVQLQIPERD